MRWPTSDDPLCRWEDFQAVMEEREPKMLRAFTAMEVDASGRLKTEQIQRAHRRLLKTQSVVTPTVCLHQLSAFCTGNHRSMLLLDTAHCWPGVQDCRQVVCCADTLERLGVSATEENAKAMIR